MSYTVRQNTVLLATVNQKRRHCTVVFSVDSQLPGSVTPSLHNALNTHPFHKSLPSIYNYRIVKMATGAWLTRTDGRARGYKQGWADRRAGRRASRRPKSLTLILISERIFVLIGFIRSHCLHSVAADVARSVVCVSVCVLVTRMYCVQTAEPIEMPFGGPKEPCSR